MVSGYVVGGFFRSFLLCDSLVVRSISRYVDQCCNGRIVLFFSHSPFWERPIHVPTFSASVAFERLPVIWHYYPFLAKVIWDGWCLVNFIMTTFMPFATAWRYALDQVSSWMDFTSPYGTRAACMVPSGTSVDKFATLTRRVPIPAISVRTIDITPVTCLYAVCPFVFYIMSHACVSSMNFT